MNAPFCTAALCLLLASSNGIAQETAKPQAHVAVHTVTHSTSAAANPESGDIEQLRQDVSRLKVLVNQMRSNLAFVQSSQSPLKHQFELESDAWQVIVEQMEGRLQRMEDRGAHTEQGR
jgi:hypothetical protein